MASTQRPQRTRNKFLREKRDRKRNEAAIRQAAYDALTTEQKLAKLGDRPAAKQRAKLAGAGQKVIAALLEAVDAAAANEKAIVAEENKPKKGTKARRQAKKDKKANA